MSDKEKLNASGVENGSTDDLKNKNAASPEANEEKASASESSVKADFSHSVEYETNDNWQFDASAPATENDVVGENGVEFELPKPKPAPAKKEEPAPQGFEPQGVVIKKETVTAVLSSLIAVVIIAILVVLGVRYYTVPNSNEKMNPGNVVMTVGNTDVSVGMYNFYYQNIVKQYVQYASNGYYDIDLSKDFSTQYTTDDDGNEISWQDRFKENTTELIKKNTIYYQKGIESGITLTDAQKEMIETQLDNIKNAASSANLGVNEYIAQTYGDNCGLETLRKYLEQNYISSVYYYQQQIKLRPSEDELNAYFKENENDYKSCSYAILEAEYDKPETTDKLWEDLYIEHIKELDMVIKKYPEGEINEFDSLDELRAFDPHFIENVDSDIFDNIEQVLGCSKSEIHDVYPLKQGLTNLSCHFRTNDGEYVYRGG